MEAVLSGMAMIQAGMADVILAGGVEHMSGVAYQVPAARWGCRLQDQTFVDALIRSLHCGSHIDPHPGNRPGGRHQGSAEPFRGQALHHGAHGRVHRPAYGYFAQEMDDVALRSHNNTERATREGLFKEEIVPFEIPQRKKAPLIFDKDEHFGRA
jgi:acetyl-CoA C-acetyltransferase